MNQFDMPVILPNALVEEVLGEYIQKELLKLPIRVISSTPTEEGYVFRLQVGSDVHKAQVSMVQKVKEPVFQYEQVVQQAMMEKAVREQQRQQQEQLPVYDTEQLPDNIQELLRAFANNSEG